MKNKSKFTYGFLFLYDWFPIMKELDGEDFKALFKAFVLLQRDGTPLPRFDDPLMQMVANMIEPTVRRRIEGQKGGLKAQENARNQGLQEGVHRYLPEPPSEAIKDKQRKDKLSIAISPSGADMLPKGYSAPAGAHETQTAENFETVDFFTAALMRSYGEDAKALLVDEKEEDSP